jgi:hypothetical protein
MEMPVSGERKYESQLEEQSLEDARIHFGGFDSRSPSPKQPLRNIQLDPVSMSAFEKQTFAYS